VVKWKKGIKVSPSEFMSRISFHDTVLGLLPGWPGQGVGAPEQRLTEYDKKQILYNGVTEEYRESFRKAGLSLNTVSLNDLIKYMDDLYIMDHTAQRALHSSSNSNSSHTRPAGRVPGRGNRSGDTSSRPGFRPYNGPGRFPSGRGRSYGSSNYSRPYYRPYHSQHSGSGGGNYQGQSQGTPQGNRGGAMSPRRLEFNGNGGRSTPAGRFGGYGAQSNNYQSAGRGTKCHYNARQTRVYREGYYASREWCGGRAQGSYGHRQGPGGSHARRTQGGNRSSHYDDPDKAYYNNEGKEEVVEDYDQVEEFDNDPNYDEYYGKEAEEDLDETYDTVDEGYDDPEEGYFAEEHCGDGFFGEVQIKDPDGLLEVDPIPEELDVTANLEEGYYNDGDSSSSPPSLTRNHDTYSGLSLILLQHQI